MERREKLDIRLLDLKKREDTIEEIKVKLEEDKAHQAAEEYAEELQEQSGALPEITEQVLNFYNARP